MSDELDFTQFGGRRIVMGDGSERWQFGWFDLPESREDVRSRLICGGQPISFRDAAPDLRGYGAGRSVNLFSIFKSSFGYELPSQYQNRGTCFPAGTPILMAGGAERPIEHVSVGDEVVTHTGFARKVLEVGRRPYAGKLVSIAPRGMTEPVWMTAEHPVAVRTDGPGEPIRWVEAKSIFIGNRVMLPSPGGGLHDAPVAMTGSTPVKKIDVYNLEVDCDHSYVAGGIAVHNCVSRGMKRAQELLLGLMKYTGWPISLDSGNLVSHAFIYGSSRKHGGLLGNQDGSVGAWAAWTVTNEGTLLNGDCGDDDNDDALAVRWGYSGPPSEMVPKAKFHLVKRVVQIGSVEEARDFLCAGLGAVTVASNVGFQTTRNSQGICRRSGSWAHQMMYGGWDDAAGAFAQAQSWGPNQPGGPPFTCAGDECPSYVFGTLAEDARVQIDDGDTWGVSWMVAWDAPTLSWRP